MSRPDADGKPSAKVTMTLRPRPAGRFQLRGRNRDTLCLAYALEDVCFRPRGLTPTWLRSDTRCRSNAPAPARKEWGPAAQQKCDALASLTLSPPRGANDASLHPRRRTSPAAALSRDGLLGSPNQGTLAKASSADRTRGVFHFARPLPRSLCENRGDRDASGMVPWRSIPTLLDHTDTFVTRE
jgi:hypothetical protein